jgi:hypothetical protein
MAFGRKKDPIVELERERNELVARRDVLEQKFDRAHAALAAATNERRTSLLDADLDDATAATRRDAVVRDARDRVEAIGDALQEIERKIADATTRLAELRTAAEQSENAREIRAAASPLADARNEAAAGLLKTLDTARALTAKVPVNVDFIPQLNSIAETFLAATGELLETAERHAAGVMNGSVPGARPPPPPLPEPPAPPIARVTIYALSPLRWKEREQTMTAPRYAWANPPRPVAALAVERGLAGLPDSEHVRRVIESFGVASGPGDPDQAIDLDRLDEPPAEQHAPSTTPEFIETIGATRTITIDAGRAQ